LGLEEEEIDKRKTMNANINIDRRAQLCFALHYPSIHSFPSNPPIGPTAAVQHMIQLRQQSSAKPRTPMPTQ
jgi:hypothetical protein